MIKDTANSDNIRYTSDEVEAGDKAGLDLANVKNKQDLAQAESNLIGDIPETDEGLSVLEKLAEAAKQADPEGYAKAEAAVRKENPGLFMEVIDGGEKDND